jgi:tetratricopeptide (TPR) repeat protein
MALLVGIFISACGLHRSPQGLSSTTPRPAFDRGMAMYYGFDYAAAISWFERAAKEESNPARAYWGIALALGPNLNDRPMQRRMAKASAAAAKAREAAGPSGRDWDLIAALSTRYTTETTFDLDALNGAYAQQMKTLAERYPSDDDIAVLYAESLILAEPAPAGHRHPVLNKPAIDVVEDVLKRNPSHLGANHYHVHLLEAVDPQRALPSARRLDRLQPEAGHLLHMPSHIYLRVGDYHAAVSSNQRAFEADLAARKATGRLPDMGYHTREYLAAVAGLTGQSETARRADDSAFVQLRFNRWADVLKRERPDEGVTLLEWHVARVLALVGLGRLREAEAARLDYNKAEAGLPADARWWGDPVAKFLPLVRHEMDARLLWAKGNRDASMTHWTKAVAAQDELTRMEALMPWFHSVREPLGAALLMSERPSEAEQVFRDELKLNPGSARALFGLWQALEAQGQASEARTVKAQFEEAWKNADVPISLELL